MIPLVDPKDRILLKPLIPKRLIQTNGQTGFEVIGRDYQMLKSCLDTSQREGLVSDDEMKDVLKDLNRVYFFFQDLSKRERRVFQESVLRNDTDSSLRIKLETSYYFFCEYLDLMIETLKRLRNSGHLSNEQYESLVTRFDTFRLLHREIISYLDNMYL